MSIELLKNIAFPWFLVDASGTLLFESKGSLFGIDSLAVSGSSRQYFLNLKKEGWFLCPQGWAIYCKKYFNDFIILPGLKIKSFSTVHGKSDQLQIKLDKAYVESHVQQVLDSTSEAQKPLRSLIHEIRSINTGVYNAAFGLQDCQDDTQRDFLLQNILGFSGILSARMDALDIISAYESVKNRPKEAIAVYAKFDKLVKCFSPRARLLGLNLKLSGSSFGRVTGPGLFEIVPFLLIENALKYSLRGTDITCSIEENRTSIECTVESYSPKITDDEKDKIFSPSFRGQFAQKTGTPGDGLGLSVLKRTVEEIYGGKVYLAANNSASTTVSGVPFCLNKFCCVFPKAGMG